MQELRLLLCCTEIKRKLGEIGVRSARNKLCAKKRASSGHEFLGKKLWLVPFFYESHLTIIMSLSSLKPLTGFVSSFEIKLARENSTYDVSILYKRRNCAYLCYRVNTFQKWNKQVDIINFFKIGKRTQTINNDKFEFW